MLYFYSIEQTDIEKLKKQAEGDKKEILKYKQMYEQLKKNAKNENESVK